MAQMGCNQTKGGFLCSIPIQRGCTMLSPASLPRRAGAWSLAAPSVSHPSHLYPGTSGTLTVMVARESSSFSPHLTSSSISDPASSPLAAFSPSVHHSSHCDLAILHLSSTPEHMQTRTTAEADISYYASKKRVVRYRKWR